jgi:fluoroacetyl-CoA thioesterase
VKNPFAIGDLKVFRHIVTAADSARFETGEVHPVYSTFALARDAEWSGRLFVLDMKEEGEEGIGTGITVDHLSPALEGEEVMFTAALIRVINNEVVTSYEALVGDRLIARGEQRQKIVAKAKLDALFASLKAS